jgi:glyoxylase-like metal-dependent hydrolase (beta-lactamase superfamily II)
MRRNYGELVPVPAERVVEAPDGYRVELGGRSLLFVDTPGHARHHFCVWDEASQGLFTGDTFGLAYPELASRRGPFILPTSTPVQFEPEPLKRSIDRLLAFAPRSLYLTHYSRVSDAGALGAVLQHRIDEMVALALAAAGRPDRGAWLRAALGERLFGWAVDHGVVLPADRVRELLAVDVELNAQGLEVWLDRPSRA